MIQMSPLRSSPGTLWRKTIWRPSGDQAGCELWRSPPVSTVRPLPSALITAICSTSLVPAVPTRKATREPSGDHDACASSTPGVAVSGASPEPSGATVSRSRPLERTMRPSAPANDAAAGAATTSPSATIVETSVRRMGHRLRGCCASLPANFTRRSRASPTVVA